MPTTEEGDGAVQGQVPEDGSVEVDLEAALAEFRNLPQADQLFEVVKSISFLASRLHELEGRLGHLLAMQSATAKAIGILYLTVSQGGHPMNDQVKAVLKVCGVTIKDPDRVLKPGDVGFGAAMLDLKGG